MSGFSWGRPGPSSGLARVGVSQRGYSGGPRPGAFRTRPRSLITRVTSGGSRLRHVDWVLIAAVLALCVIGVLLVWSATEPSLAQRGANPRTYLDKQAVFVVLGLVMMVLVSLVDYRQLRVWAPVAYGAAVLALLAVLTPLGATVNGAAGWIDLPGGFQIEPSEYAKIALILMTAMLFSELREGARDPSAGRPGASLRDVGIVIACGLPLIALVIIEPALGISMVLVVVLAGMILLSGIQLRWVVGLLVVAAVGLTAVLSLHLLKSYQLTRFSAFLHPTSDAAGSGYNAIQAKIAIGSGGMFGQGLFHGQSVSGSYVPAQSTDFIFTVAGQELGFVGAVVIVALLGVVVVRALRIATRADDMFGTLVASGVAIWFLFQSFVNVGMTVGIMPITGLPLPFISYGGSAVFADMIAVGLLLSVHRKRQVFE
ncbi:MAG TPA: rod shape-determining protein RodA [Streptosporangiaceae bacterium]|jgi:rod shape determining protein RodA|nr:rod shape-determining protein RodA [Streptosporangiaceae bacterium]